MVQPPSFLTAEWRNLGLVTYDVDPSMLRPLLPPSCELDLRDERAFVSFVMFDFRQTRVKGVRWPGYVNFPEINLRFYVRHAGQRGVCFVRELVPKRLIAWIARTIYNEPYRATPMHSEITRVNGTVLARHRFFFAGRWHDATIQGRASPVRPSTDSIEHFFKEHEWGFGQSRSGALRRYRVVHPEWDIYPEAQATLDVDFGAVYGQQWAILNDCARARLCSRWDLRLPSIHTPTYRHKLLMMPEPYTIVVFDGECAFCDRSVKWIIDHDRAGRFRFTPRQSPAGQRLLAEHGLPPEGVESMILVDGSAVSTHSTAVLRIAKKLPFPWKASAAFLLVPRFIRDFCYRWMARRRYKIAGKMPVCSVPTAAQRERILDEVRA